MEIQFLGAAGGVTGSMHKITIDGMQVLLDCGMFQGRRKESERLNRDFRFSPQDIHSIILSHAHIDHSGRIPLIVKEGFSGSIFATSATEDLCNAMLRDSAFIQVRNVRYLNKRLQRQSKPLIEPLYTLTDAENALACFQGIGYNRRFHVLRDMQCTFLDAGHILGSAQVQLDIKNGNGSDGVTKILFTGDLGRCNLPILRDPVEVKDVDYLIVESTYGDRKHSPIEEAQSELLQIVSRVINRGGKIIIPSFSVGRTQEMIYSLHELYSTMNVPKVPIYVDSPLSANVTEIFRHHSECYDEETKQYLLKDEDPFGFESLVYIRSVEKSKALNSVKESCLIISASGMCEHGRIVHHLKNNIEDPKNMVLIIGFMAEHTLGRRLVEKQKKVNILGESYNVNAEIKVLNAFSAHADADDLVEYVSHVNSGTERKLKKVFVVHGEQSQSEAFSKRITDDLGIEAAIPEMGETFGL